MPPLSEEQLAADIENALAAATTVQNPVFRKEIQISFAYLRHAMSKIAYELAFLWLGESYLDDPTAAKLRVVIRNEDVP